MSEGAKRERSSVERGQSGSEGGKASVMLTDAAVTQAQGRLTPHLAGWTVAEESALAQSALEAFLAAQDRDALAEVVQYAAQRATTTRPTDWARAIVDALLDPVEDDA